MPPADDLPRVCVVSSLYHRSLGGLGRQAVALTEKLRERGVRIFVIARRMDEVPECAFSGRVPVIRAPALFSRVHNLEAKSPKNLCISLSFCLSAARFLVARRKEYDLVHFHGASLPLLCNAPLLALLGKRIIAKVASAGLGTEAGSLHGRYVFLGKAMIRLLKRVDRFIATSGEIERGLLADGFEKQRIARIPNFIDPRDFHPAAPGEKEAIRARLGFGHERIAVFSGRLVERKGVSVLLDAWDRLGEARKGCKLLILGTGPYEGMLLERSRELGLEKTVRFEGHLTEIRAHLAMSDLFVFPSFQEGLPNSVLEAMACGLPVVAARIGGVEDLVRPGGNGLLVEPGCVLELAQAMKSLLHDPLRAAAMGKEAHSDIEKNHDIERIADRYLRLYGELAGPARREGFEEAKVFRG